MGRSKYQPAVPNNDDSARALNRRVEIIITHTIQTNRQTIIEENTP